MAYQHTRRNIYAADVVSEVVLPGAEVTTPSRTPRCFGRLAGATTTGGDTEARLQQARGVRRGETFGVVLTHAYENGTFTCTLEVHTGDLLMTSCFQKEGGAVRKRVTRWPNEDDLLDHFWLCLRRNLAKGYAIVQDPCGVAEALVSKPPSRNVKKRKLAANAPAPCVKRVVDVKGSLQATRNHLPDVLEVLGL